MPGPYPSKVDSLTFVIRYPNDVDSEHVPSISDLRLFSSGGGSELLEWNVEKSFIRVGKYISHISSLNSRSL